MIVFNGIYDSLFIGHKLQQKIGDFSEGEIQLFSYLACLLALYDGRETSSWGYMFIKNENGSPYSDNVSSGLYDLINGGFLVSSDNGTYLKITDKGSFLFDKIKDHSVNAERETYLGAATLMIDFFPYGVLTKAINDEPILQSSKVINSRRNLLDEEGSGHALLHEQFQLLKSTIDWNNEGLLTPAYLWLNSLAFYSRKLASNE